MLFFQTRCFFANSGTNPGVPTLKKPERRADIGIVTRKLSAITSTSGAAECIVVSLSELKKEFRMKFFRPKKTTGFTLVEIMIVVLIIGILLAIAIPNFVAARESSRAKACVGNLKQIDSATQQYCMDKKLSSSTYAASLPTIDTTATTGLVGTSGYIRALPVCPSSGTYAVAANITLVPTCSVVTSNASDTNYQSGGKFYHGM